MQMTFADAVSHRMLVVEIATTAKTQGRSPLLGVLYDELARSVFTHILSSRSTCLFRKEWEDLSLKLGDKFVISSVVGQLSEETLRHAKNLHDTLFKDKAQVVLLTCMHAHRYV